MSHRTSVAVGVVRRGFRRCTRLLALLTVVIPTAVILNSGIASVGSDHWVEGRVLDASASVTPDPCPDLVAAVTGNPRSGPPTSEQVVGCLARAEAEGSRTPVAGAPCAGAHITETTFVLVRDGQGRCPRILATAQGTSVHRWHALRVLVLGSDPDREHILVLHPRRQCGVGDLRSTPPVTLANRSHRLTESESTPYTDESWRRRVVACRGSLSDNVGERPNRFNSSARASVHARRGAGSCRSRCAASRPRRRRQSSAAACSWQRCPRHQSRISRSVALLSAWSTTTACTSSPHVSSGTPITATSCTAGWAPTRFSISDG